MFRTRAVTPDCYNRAVTSEPLHPRRCTQLSTQPFQEGSGPNGGAGGRGCPVTVGGEPKMSVTQPHAWFKANATNSGGFSAVCMLTAQRLYAALDRKV